MAQNQELSSFGQYLTVNTASNTVTFSGISSLSYSGSANSTLIISGTNTKGGAGFHDFMMVRNGGGGTNPNKWFRINSTGGLEILNSAYSSIPLSLSDSGNLSVAGTIASTGVFVNNKKAVNGPAFYAYPDPGAAAQSITSGSLQKVTFGLELFDTDSCFSSSRFTPNVEGYYQLNSTVRFDGSTGTSEAMIVVYKNGAEYSRGWNTQGVQFATDWFSMSVSTLAYANGTTDYFEIFVQQGSGANRTITRASSSITYFNGCMVRGA